MAGLIGRPVPRLEDLRLIAGKGRYTDDVRMSGAAHAYVVRSPHAHAEIAHIDTGAAAAAPGVLAVLTAADYRADGNRPIPHNSNPPHALDESQPSFVPLPGMPVFENPQPALADGRVRHVGEAVVLVVAETAAQVRDAAELVDVDYEMLPAVVAADRALAEDAPRLWAGAPGNVALMAEMGSWSDVDALFAAAPTVVEREFRNQRVVNCQMEPRAANASYDPGTGTYTITAGSQGIGRQRMAVAHALATDIANIRLISPDVGGGFGPRTSLNPEVVLVAWAARKVGRPVRWVSDRSEAFLSDYQGRDQVATVGLAFDADGRILAARADQIYNVGAHPVSYAPLANGYRVLTTVYDVPDGAVRIRGALTNTTPTAPYRGAGRPEATHAIERLLDIAAGRFGIDRIEIRRRNLIARNLLPYTNAMGLTYDSGDFRGNMDAALDQADWEGFAARAQDSRGRGMLRGIGVANYVEAPVGAPRERVVVSVGADGAASIVAGTQSTGQGHETTFAQVVADRLGLDLETVTLVTGDSDKVSAGGGSHSDRSMRLAGTILFEACEKIIAECSSLAARLLQCDEDMVVFEDGAFTAPKTDREYTVPSLVAAAHNAGLLQEASVEATAEISRRIPAHPTGCAICELEVDPETGVTTIEHYTSIDDVGQAINPLVVDGQVHGGIAQGVGQALHEMMAMDGDSGQILAGSFMDYCVPHADALPSFDVALTEDPTGGNPLRVKGGGEGGITPATAAVMNALAHALGAFGIEDIDMPATPQRVWALIDDARAGRRQVYRKEEECLRD